MMKKIMFSACFMAVSVILLAQNRSVDRVFEKYAGKEGFTIVYISKYMFDMFTQMDDMDKEDHSEMKEVYGKLDGIKILAVEDERLIGKGLNFYDEIMQDLDRDAYKELMVVKDSQEDVIFLAREGNGYISELLLIVGGESDNVLIAITGEINLNTITKLSQSMDIKGMEKLEELEDQE